MVKLSKLILDSYEELQKKAMTRHLLNNAFEKSLDKVYYADTLRLAHPSVANENKYYDALLQFENFKAKRLLHPPAGKRLFGLLKPKMRHSSFLNLQAKNRTT